MSDDKRGKATDEDSDLSCDHGPRMRLKTQPEMENETFDGGEVKYQACPATLCFFFFYFEALLFAGIGCYLILHFYILNKIRPKGISLPLSVV